MFFHKLSAYGEVSALVHWAVSAIIEYHVTLVTWLQLLLDPMTCSSLHIVACTHNKIVRSTHILRNYPFHHIGGAITDDGVLT